MISKITNILAFSLFLIGFTNMQLVAQINEGLVLNLPFNGNANDETISFLTGEVHNAQLTTGHDGTPNSAYSFNGIDAYIVIPHSDVFNFTTGEDFTLSVWMKQPALQNNTIAGDNYIISKWKNEDNSDPSEWTGGYPFAVRLNNQTATNHPPGRVYFIRWDGSDFLGGCETSSGISSTTEPPADQIGAYNDNEWHLFLFRVEGSIIQMFVDGEYYGQNPDNTGQAGQGCHTLNNAPLIIGTGHINSAFFTGAIDELKVWNRALTDEEISTLVATQEVVDNKQITIQSNPVINSTFWIQTSAEDKVASYQIYSSTGQLLQAQHLAYSMEAVEVQLEAVSSELLIVLLEMESGEWVRKRVVVQR